MEWFSRNETYTTVYAFAATRYIIHRRWCQIDTMQVQWWMRRIFELRGHHTLDAVVVAIQIVKTTVDRRNLHELRVSEMKRSCWIFDIYVCIFGPPLSPTPPPLPSVFHQRTRKRSMKSRCCATARLHSVAANIKSMSSLSEHVSSGSRGVSALNAIKSHAHTLFCISFVTKLWSRNSTTFGRFSVVWYK